MSLSAPALIFLLFAPIDGEAWRPPELVVKDRAPVTNFEELRSIALEYVGRPYVMGGVGNPGIDCSGFTCRVFAEAGYAIPRVSRDQAHAGVDVPLDQLEPGDLLFFSENPGETRIVHVGIFLGDDEIVHASSGQGEVVVARLGARWFKERLVVARRVLQKMGAPPIVSKVTPPRVFEPQHTSTVAPTLELVEHSGADVLPIMLRRPARVARASYGPELVGRKKTAIGVRALGATEDGKFGMTIAPEASLFIQSIALDIALVLPIRLEPGRGATLGKVKSPKDVERFIRSVSIGLRGADLDLRLSQLGDLTLLDGLVVDKLAPGSRAAGIPGLSTTRTPLSFFGSVNTGYFQIEALADDVVDPEVMGGAISVPIIDGLKVGAGISTDQNAQLMEGRRAIDVVEGKIGYDLVDNGDWTVAFTGSGSAIRALDQTGALGILRAFAEHRFDKGFAVGAAGRAGFMGHHALDALFGATYLGSKIDHLDALRGAASRPFAGGELHLTLGKVVGGILYEDALGDGRIGLDRRLEALAEIQSIPLGGTRLLDLRVAYASRGIQRPGPTEHVLHAGAQLRLSSWLRLEGYLEKSERFEGGAGVAVGFEL